VDRKRRATFDDIPDQYDRIRPGYPDALIEDVIRISGIPDGGRILEIGCGPGTATLPFARRGYHMLCIEIGERMAAFAAEKCRQFPNVCVLNAAFEKWPVEPEAFDLVISGSAFHWVPQASGYARCAAALRSGGCVAFFWHMSPTADDGFFQEVQDVYRRHLPRMAKDPAARGDLDAGIARRQAAVEACGHFSDVRVLRYPWSRQFTADQYVQWLDTHSDHRVQDPQPRAALYEEIRRMILQRGGTVTRPFLSVLFIARKGR
jgi:SAM-dependent methyltransferase